MESLLFLLIYRSARFYRSAWLDVIPNANWWIFKPADSVRSVGLVSTSPVEIAEILDAVMEQKIQLGYDGFGLIHYILTRHNICIYLVTAKFLNLKRLLIASLAFGLAPRLDSRLDPAQQRYEIQCQPRSV